ncbi:MAG: nucleotidyltransferase domain-containing protein [Planctomycetota bacterium]
MNRSEILLRSNRDPLFGLTPEALVASLRRKLDGRVREAYFFGGFAGGRLTSRSDIDVILVQDTNKPFPRRGEDFLDLYDVVPALDLLVYTPREFALLTENPTLGFWKSVVGTLQRFL